MKLMHLSDLHLGRRFGEFSLIEDQKYVLDQITVMAGAEKPDAVIIAGDIYDKSVPSVEAVQLFDDFLCAIAVLDIKVFVISGNHDSPERVSFGARLMDRRGVYLSQVYDGSVKPITLQDAFGLVDVYLLPFLRPSSVRRFFPDIEISSYHQALSQVIGSMQLDATRRNLLITHQFVTGALLSESEDITVGTADNVDAAVFDAFDYVALGHIHRPQSVGRETVRYCGTPLKYSFSEARQEKSVTMVELSIKGDTRIKTMPLIPLRDVREMRGTFAELTARTYYQSAGASDYLHITLTDEDDVMDAIGKLRVVYPHVVLLDYDNIRTRSSQVLAAIDQVEKSTPLQLFGDFYEKQNGSPMTQEQRDYISGLIAEIWEDY